jgi:predicted nucleic-acid-binding Zn-ribbon protein
MKDGDCPKCASQNIMAGVEILDRGRQGARPLRVNVLEPDPPNHGFIWTQVESSGDLRAWICAACGYTELYTDNLPALYESYRKGHP